MVFGERAVVAALGGAVLVDGPRGGARWHRRDELSPHDRPGWGSITGPAGVVVPIRRRAVGVPGADSAWAPTPRGRWVCVQGCGRAWVRDGGCGAGWRRRSRRRPATVEGQLLPWRGWRSAVFVAEVAVGRVGVLRDCLRDCLRVCFAVLGQVRCLSQRGGGVVMRCACRWWVRPGSGWWSGLCPRWSRARRPARAV